MGTNPEFDARRKAATRQKIIETGFRVFAERTIDAVNMTDIANAAGLAAPTVYSYYRCKEPLIMDISAWVWGRYTSEIRPIPEEPGQTAAERFEYFLESFLDLYRNHRDMLRFNQFFNVYVQRESVTPERMRPFLQVIEALEARFHGVYALAQRDGTLRTDVPEREMFSAALHLMLAAVTRYAVGLIYDAGVDPEKELILARDLLLQAYRT